MKYEIRLMAGNQRAKCIRRLAAVSVIEHALHDSSITLDAMADNAKARFQYQREINCRAISRYMLGLMTNATAKLDLSNRLTETNNVLITALGGNWIEIRKIA